MALPVVPVDAEAMVVVAEPVALAEQHMDWAPVVPVDQAESAVMPAAAQQPAMVAAPDQ